MRLPLLVALYETLMVREVEGNDERDREKLSASESECDQEVLVAWLSVELLERDSISVDKLDDDVGVALTSRVAVTEGDDEFV